MANNKVCICGVDTSKLPTLSAVKSRELLERVKEGSDEAREEFIRCNLRLVLSVIQRFSSRGEQMDDLFQVGCIGLIKAIDNFDLGHNVRFSTYAVPMIIGEVRRHLRDNNAVRVSRSMRDNAYRALQVRARLMEENSDEPRISDIAKELEMEEAEVVFALDSIQDPISLFEPVYHDDGDAIYVLDQVRDESCSEEMWLRDIAIDGALEKLNDREQRILLMRFYKGKTQVEVANELGISQAQVSRLEKNALNQMKKYV